MVTLKGSKGAPHNSNPYTNPLKTSEADRSFTRSLSVSLSVCLSLSLSFPLVKQMVINTV